MGAFGEAVLSVYNGAWRPYSFSPMGKGDPTEYYKIAASLIPTEIHHTKDNTIRVIIALVPPITNTPLVIEAAHNKGDSLELL